MSSSNINSLRKILPKFEDLNILNEYPFIKEIEHNALKEAYKLIVLLNGSNIQIGTSESLTAGLIMSTLVRIPLGGWHKYGCFGVYDTDAKRVFNTVEIDNVYTHTCAKEMAIGILKNSNATLAIAVTGNAMPYYKEIEKLGEVFIGIAGYVENNGNVEIIYSTKSINACLENTTTPFLSKCKQWIKSQTDKTFAPIEETTNVSFMIRIFTVYQALKECQEFYTKNKLISTDFIKIQKENNTKITNVCYHKNIPEAKYPDVGKLKVTCINQTDCTNSQSCDRLGSKELRLTNNALVKGGYKKKTRKTKFLKKT